LNKCQTYLKIIFNYRWNFLSRWLGAPYRCAVGAFILSISHRKLRNGFYSVVHKSVYVQYAYLHMGTRYTWTCTAADNNTIYTIEHNIFRYRTTHILQPCVRESTEKQYMHCSRLRYIIYESHTFPPHRCTRGFPPRTP